jgi:5,10-methylene-tetrahydrofolate dehydrogenase/methenyl tetrahydrofolate cyclohydrolase
VRRKHTHLVWVFIGVTVSGAHVVVVGRSKIVGWPAAQLFMWKNATVTMCHSRTADLAEQCRRADILIVAVGKKELIKGITLTISLKEIHARR